MAAAVSPARNVGPLPSAAIKTATSAPSAAALAAAIRKSRPKTEAAPWVEHAVSSLVRRRALKTAGSLIASCGFKNEGAALDVAMAASLASMARALVLPRGMGRAAGALLNAATVAAWGAYALRRVVDASLRMQDAYGSETPSSRRSSMQRAGTGSSERLRPSSSWALHSVLRYARALLAYYEARAKREPMRIVASVAVVTAFLLVLALRHGRVSAAAPLLRR